MPMTLEEALEFAGDYIVNNHEYREAQFVGKVAAALVATASTADRYRKMLEEPSDEVIEKVQHIIYTRLGREHKKPTLKSIKRAIKAYQDAMRETQCSHTET